VDAEGDREVLSVVLSAAPVPPGRHARPPGADDGAWSVRLDVPKERAP
jgi:hypothetical protein